MADLKTKPTAASVETFLAGIEDEERRQDAVRVLDLMREVSGEEPRMWGAGDYDALLSKLGKHKTGKSCLYVNRLEDVDEDVLRELVKRSVEHMRDTWS